MIKASTQTVKKLRILNRGQKEHTVAPDFLNPSQIPRIHRHQKNFFSLQKILKTPLIITEYTLRAFNCICSPLPSQFATR